MHVLQETLPQMYVLASRPGMLTELAWLQLRPGGDGEQEKAERPYDGGGDWVNTIISIPTIRISTRFTGSRKGFLRTKT